MSFNLPATERLIKEFMKANITSSVDSAVVAQALKDGATPDPCKEPALSAFHHVDPLKLSAFYGKTKLCALLLEYGAEIEMGGVLRRTPLICAAMGRHPKTCQLLLNKGANVDALDDHQKSALTHAVIEGFVGVANVLIKHGASLTPAPQKPVLIDAVKSGHMKMVTFLLDQGADANAVDQHGLSALIWAVTRGRLDMCELLLNKGANAGYISPKNMAPLTCALTDSQYFAIGDSKIAPPIFQLLLDHGADPNLLMEGQTLEAYAMDNGAFKIVDMILEHNAKQDQKKWDGMLPSSPLEKKKGFRL